ncbi:MAG: YkgJ family cysteine cluster protein [Acidobacteriota bacterium]|nr:YkgJ family cysteine cluster protein [Acidobacteriota bacterium]
MAEQVGEMVTVEFAVGIGDGQFKASATVPAGQTNLTQILPVLQSLSSSFIEGVTAQLAESGQPVSCRAGCGACCRQMAPISIFEAEALSAWIRTLPEARQEQLASRFHQALVALGAAGIIDRMVEEDWQAETESARKLALDYLYARVPCPLLEEESCSIHPIRPLICREYLVTSPPEHCADPAHLQVVPVHLPLNFSRILKAIGKELEQDSRGWIPLVFLFAWMKSGARPGDAVAGTGPQVLYEFVKRMSEAVNRVRANDVAGGE